MSTFAFPARLTLSEGGGWGIRFRDFPEAISDCSAGEDAVDVASGCLQAAIEGRLLDGLAIPQPSEAKAGEVTVPVPLETAAKAALFQAVAASGMTRTDLARAVNLDEKEIRRMLDPRHASKLPRIARVLQALGRQLTVSVGDVEPVRKALEARERRAGYRIGRTSKAR